ncbi:MAG: hypothetical protein FWC43_09325, partial [Planctomycetaceae bacterium]|nr:hypothetical protein [Planctomycetaceae bacterium]
MGLFLTKAGKTPVIIAEIPARFKQVDSARELHCSKWIENEGTSGNAGILPAPGFAGFQPASRRQDACV